MVKTGAGHCPVLSMAVTHRASTGTRRGEKRKRAGGKAAVCCMRGKVSSVRGESDQQDRDVDQKFATVEIPRPGLSLSLVLIKGYSIIMPRGGGVPST